MTSLVNKFYHVARRLLHVPQLHLAKFYPSSALISTTPCRRGLEEFFDEKDNWSKSEVRVGRSWKKDELRIKSNEDLHKLWFVLLKERNMLLTMEHEYKRNMVLFPSPERLDKVKESMTNLEDVVRERNRAYHELETGETGERPGRPEKNRFGLTFFYRPKEYFVPPGSNKSWYGTRRFWYSRHETSKFLLYFREKLWQQKRRARVREWNHVCGLLKRYPDINMDALQEQHPDVDIKRVRAWRRSQGHYAP